MGGTETQQKREEKQIKRQPRKVIFKIELIQHNSFINYKQHNNMFSTVTKN